MSNYRRLMSHERYLRLRGSLVSKKELDYLVERRCGIGSYFETNKCVLVAWAQSIYYETQRPAYRQAMQVDEVVEDFAADILFLRIINEPSGIQVHLLKYFEVVNEECAKPNDFKDCVRILVLLAFDEAKENGLLSNVKGNSIQTDDALKRSDSKLLKYPPGVG